MDEVMKTGKQVRERLRQLGLTSQDLHALCRQGFVAGEYRQRGGKRWGPYFKLRFRRDGRQRVCYLGCDRKLADEVRDALAAWQQPLRLRREVDRLLKDTRRALRLLRESVSPHVVSATEHWHGYALRRSRDEHSPPDSTGKTSRVTCTITQSEKEISP